MTQHITTDAQRNFAQNLGATSGDLHTQRHVNDLLEVLNELLTVPELMPFEPDEMFDHTLEVMAKARTIRAAVLDELAER